MSVEEDAGGLGPGVAVSAISPLSSCSSVSLLAATGGRAEGSLQSPMELSAVFSEAVDMQAEEAEIAAAAATEMRVASGRILLRVSCLVGTLQTGFALQGFFVVCFRTLTSSDPTHPASMGSPGFARLCPRLPGPAGRLGRRTLSHSLRKSEIRCCILS